MAYFGPEYPAGLARNTRPDWPGTGGRFQSESVAGLARNTQFKTFYNARRVIIGIELAQKIHKRQFAIPITLQSNPAVTWRHVMAA